FWIWAMMRFAGRTRIEAAERAPVEPKPTELGARSVLILVTIAMAFSVFLVGIMKFGWDFDQLSAPFVAMGIVAGLVGGLGVSGTALAFAEGFASMASAAMLIGIARAISVVLEQGHVIDTLVHGLVTPLESLPAYASAFGMLILHVAVHVPVPSVSGQAVLT